MVRTWGAALLRPYKGLGGGMRKRLSDFGQAGGLS